MTVLQWRLRELLDEEGISAYALVQTCSPELSHNTVYALCRGNQKSVSVRTLEIIINRLEEMLDREVALEEIIYKSN